MSIWCPRPTFPWLSANTALSSGSHEEAFAPYIVKEIHGVLAVEELRDSVEPPLVLLENVILPVVAGIYTSTPT